MIRGVTDWIALVLSLIAIVISGIAYTSGLPRLKITASRPAMIVGAGPGWGPFPVGITVTLTNDGGAAAQIDGVYMVADGCVAKRMAGPKKFPMPLEARGGSARWQFDYNDLRAQLGEKIRRDLRDPQAPLLSATVQYGSKLKQSKPVQVNLPGVPDQSRDECAFVGGIAPGPSDRPQRGGVRCGV